MTNDEKGIIALEVTKQSKKTSQGNVAVRCDVSDGTISSIVNGNWKHISPEMWRRIKVKLRIYFNWAHFETGCTKKISKLMMSAQQKHLTIGFSHSAGRGKSQSFKRYMNKYKNVIYVECNRTMNMKMLIQALLLDAGRNTDGTTHQLKKELIKHVAGLEIPMIVMDQFDKLKDGPFDLFMDLYNELFGGCAFVISGVEALKERVKRGVNLKKIGYEEIWSRLNRKWIPLPETTYSDVEGICHVNGVTDVEEIRTFFETCEGDIRRVRQDVEKYHLIKSAA